MWWVNALLYHPAYLNVGTARDSVAAPAYLIISLSVALRVASRAVVNTLVPASFGTLVFGG